MKKRNQKRAERINNVLFGYQTGELEGEFRLPADNENIIAWLLTDIRHWCDKNKVNFRRELKNSREHYAAEQKREEA